MYGNLYVGRNQTTSAFNFDTGGNVIYEGTGGVRIPSGNTAERPFTDGVMAGSIPCRANGYIRFNTTTGKYEGYGLNQNTGYGEWGDIGGVASGQFQVIDGADQNTRIKVDNTFDNYNGFGLRFLTKGKTEFR